MERGGPSSQPLDADSSVRSTDTDALVSRSSAASLGYFSDPFSSFFLSPAQRRSPERRPPLINIGTHARTWAVDALVQHFLDSCAVKGKQCQVLSVGSGTDTRFWRMRKAAEGKGVEWGCRRWVEVDFAEATSSKARVVSMKSELKAALGGSLKIVRGGTGLSAPSYELLPGDLRSFSELSSSLLSPSTSSSTSSSTSADDPILDLTLPTLLLAECVLVYLPVETTETILSWVATTFKDAAAVSYDPFGLHDNFGKVMVRNLAARNLSLPSVSSTPDLDSLSRRFEVAGFSETTSLSIRQIRETVLPPEEVARVAKLEMIDEVEELNLVLEHYAISFSSKGDVKVDLPRR